MSVSKDSVFKDVYFIKRTIIDSFESSDTVRADASPKMKELMDKKFDKDGRILVAVRETNRTINDFKFAAKDTDTIVFKFRNIEVLFYRRK